MNSCECLQFRHFLARHLTYSRRNNRYSLSQMILALIYPIVLGLDRIETASLLRSNGTFQHLTGLQSFPDPQTLRRFLRKDPIRLWEQFRECAGSKAGDRGIYASLEPKPQAVHLECYRRGHHQKDRSRAGQDGADQTRIHPAQGGKKKAADLYSYIRDIPLALSALRTANAPRLLLRACRSAALGGGLSDNRCRIACSALAMQSCMFRKSVSRAAAS
jgi:hypothetical protein